MRSRLRLALQARQTVSIGAEHVTDRIRSYRSFVDGEYGQVHVRIAEPEKPSYPPLICLHQSPKSGREFALFMREAAHDRMVIAPDYPGYGESDRPPSQPMVTIEDYARVMWTVVDALGIDGRIDLLGNHTGSEVAAEMAVQRPDKVGRIAMISAPVLTDEELREMDAFFQPIPLDLAGTRFVKAWERAVEQRSDGLSLERMAMQFAEHLRGGEAYEWGHHAAFAYAPRFTEVLQQLPHEILILNPEDMLYAVTPRAAPLLKNGQVVDCSQWSHEVLNVHPGELYAALQDAFAGSLANSQREQAYRRA